MLAARVLLLAISMLAVSATGVPAGEAATADVEILRDSIRANKKALVAANLKLTDDEAKQFWPLYDRYAEELKALNDRRLKIIEDYIASFDGLSDEKAMKLADDYLGVEEDHVKLRRTYLPQFAKTMPGKKVARFFQIENKMDAVMRYELAAEIPVLDE
jgi:hypothetical protein